MDMTENPNYYFVDKPYKSKYICADCKKVFKRRILSDITSDNELEEKEPKCPDCGNLTSWIGPKFRAPKSDNIKAWNSIRVLNDIGVFNMIGFASDKMTIPETKKGLQDLLTEMKEYYQWTINRWITMEYSPDNKNQIRHFSDAIKRIDKHLKVNK
jgi:DNA-directed RNA polymerase subunit RPC12/RpoP